MAVAKRNTYIDAELAWLETKSDELKKFIDDRPFDKLVDNKGDSIGTQMKMLTDLMEKYIRIVDAINKLRAVDDTKKKSSVRGDLALTPFEQRII